jgi:enoyl-CoA hydratase/carnithine racemase
MPFAVSERDGVLSLTLDTPKSPINIFNHETAHQLIDILSTVSPATTRAVVFETAKANSFINGVGLLLAHASRNYDDVVRASTPPWTAYRAVRELPVPTIAVVRGNCFGCGVEFALNCDYRIATDEGETQFYMTEVNDYLFTPLFGSTWNLPATVGLSAAVDLLLWGERWQAERAYAGGLIDELMPGAQRQERTRRFLQRVLAGEQPTRARGRVAWSAHEDALVQRAQQRIDSLPPQYHQVYRDALTLLQTGARQVGSYAEHQLRELRCSADSALSANGKAAYAFFYLRQMASERAAGRRRGDDAPLTLSVDADAGADAAALAADLRRREPAGIRVTASDTADFRLVARAQGENPAPTQPERTVALHAGFTLGPAGGNTVAEIYVPAYRSGGRLLELATRGDESRLAKEDLGKLTRALQRFGFEVAQTLPGKVFVSNRFLSAYLSPLLAYLERYGDATIVNASLRQAGFVRRHALIAGFGARGSGLAPLVSNPSLLASLADPDYSAAPDGVVLDALCISLLDAVLVARERGELRDAPTADVVARELLDFPRHLTSLCSWLKRERVARALHDDARVASLVSDAALARARAFAAEGREFYR